MDNDEFIVFYKGVISPYTNIYYKINEPLLIA